MSPSKQELRDNFYDGIAPRQGLTRSRRELRKETKRRLRHWRLEKGGGYIWRLSEGAEIILVYVALNPGCTKYDLSRKLTIGGRNPFPYSSVCQWVEELLQPKFLLEILSGKTRAGLDKKGYRITLQSFSYLPKAVLYRNLLGEIIKTNAVLSPLPAGQLEEALNHVEEPYSILEAVPWIQRYETPSDFTIGLRQLFRELVWYVKWADPEFGENFVKTVFQRLIDLNDALPSVREEALLALSDYRQSIRREEEMLNRVTEAIGAPPKRSLN